MTSTIQRKHLRRLRAAPLDYGESFHAILDLSGIAADTPYLIPLNDSNMPHVAALNTAFLLKSLNIQAEVESSGVYDILFGVITENDPTDGSVDWFARFQMETSGGNVLSFERTWPDGFNLEISGGSPVWFRTNSRDQANTDYQDDAYITTPFGSALPDVGDVIMRVEEVSGSGTIDLFAELEYDTL